MQVGRGRPPAASLGGQDESGFGGGGGSEEIGNKREGAPPHKQSDLAPNPDLAPREIP